MVAAVMVVAAVADPPCMVGEAVAPAAGLQCAAVVDTSVARQCAVAEYTLAGMAGVRPFAVVVVGLMAAAPRCADPECISAAGTMAARALVAARRDRAHTPDAR